jgi:hypothetical protein
MSAVLKEADAHASDFVRAAVARMQASPPPASFDAHKLMPHRSYDGPVYSGDPAGRCHLEPEALVEDEAE